MAADAPLELIPLGGLGEFGMNMMAVSWRDTTVLIDAGVIGLLFGRGNAGSATNTDDKGDGVTNPASSCTTDGTSSGTICNNHASTSSDDDGGYLRMAATSYYAAPIAL